MNIRNATAEDANAVAALLGELDYATTAEDAALRIDRMPFLVAKETVRAAANFPATIEGMLVLQTVKEVSHHGGVVRPAFRRRLEIVIAVQKSDPVAGRIAARDAD